DDEGVPTRRTVIIDKGVLKNYFLNTYTARKLGMTTTGNAARGITGNAGIGHGNLFMEPGEKSGAEIIASIPNGFYVTELMGLGAAAFWWLDYQSRRAVAQGPVLTTDARAYLKNLQLSEVQMQAAESYLKQAVVEIGGKIGNNGDRVVKLVEVNCVFRDAYGQ